MGYKRPRMYSMLFSTYWKALIDGATYYIGNPLYYGEPPSTAGAYRNYVPRAGRIRAGIISMRCGAITSNEDIVMTILINGTTEYTFCTVGDTVAQKVFYNYALDIPVAAGDYVEFKVVCPVWVTNPTAAFGGHILIECP